MAWDQQSDWSDEKLQSYLKMCTLIGYPVQISFKNLQHSEGPVRTSGVLQQVLETDFMVDLELPATLAVSGVASDFQIATKQALVQFETLVRRTESPSRLYFEIPRNIEYIQRRMHMRANVQIDSNYMAGGSHVPVPIKIINLSVGGAAYSTQVQQDVGNSITLCFEALELAPAEIPARVVRCTPTDSGSWVVAVKFELLNPAQEARIAQYVATALNESQ